MASARSPQHTQLTSTFQLVRVAGGRWVEHRAPRAAAALAFYAIFSLAPVLMIAIAIAGIIFGRDAAHGQVAEQLTNLVGREGGQAVEAMLLSVKATGGGLAATVFGMALVLIGAMGVFAELQDSLNVIWQVDHSRRRWLTTARNRLLPLLVIFGIALLLIGLLVANTVLSILPTFSAGWQATWLDYTIHLVLSFGLLSGLFAMVFKCLPDARVAWRDVWLGSTVTAALFVVGNALIGIYLRYSAISSAYGAAGSLAVLLVWLYYSAQIFIFGAELTKVFADQYGEGLPG